MAKRTHVLSTQKSLWTPDVESHASQTRSVDGYCDETNLLNPNLFDEDAFMKMNQGKALQL